MEMKEVDEAVMVLLSKRGPVTHTPPQEADSIHITTAVAQVLFFLLFFYQIIN
jgi:hypothetical protein